MYVVNQDKRKTNIKNNDPIDQSLTIRSNDLKTAIGAISELISNQTDQKGNVDRETDTCPCTE